MKRWEFWPDQPRERKYRKYKPNRENKNPEIWTAPEHRKMVRDMERVFPVNELGLRIEGRERELKIDIRPNIMIPARPTYMGF